MAPADRPGFLQHHQEGGLKRVLGVIGIAEHTAANAQDHWSVPRQNRLEGDGISLFDETVKELRVGQPRIDTVGEQSLDLPQCDAQCLDGHRPGPSSSLSLHSIMRAEWGRSGQFFSRELHIRRKSPLLVTMNFEPFTERP